MWVIKDWLLLHDKCLSSLCGMILLCFPSQILLHAIFTSENEGPVEAPSRKDAANVKYIVQDSYADLR
jgi:hypothetical protein